MPVYYFNMQYNSSVYIMFCVIDKIPCSYHLPIAAFDICNKLAKAQSHKVDKESSVVILNWYTAGASCIQEYGNVSQQFINKVSIPKEEMTCSNKHCKEGAHRHDINTLYADFCTALFDASKRFIEKGSNNEHMVPGLNDIVTDLHAEARDAYVGWRNFGQPRFGPLCQLMRRTSLSFKY